MRRSVVLALALIAFALPASAQACRVFISPDQRIAMGRGNEAIKAVAVVEIVEARHIGEAMSDTHPWEARARIVRRLSGGPDLPRHISFQRGWGSSMCEWNLPPLPKSGERWVIYFWIDRDGKYQAWLAVTAAEARTFDPTLSKARL